MVDRSHIGLRLEPVTTFVETGQHFLRPQSQRNEVVSLAQRRLLSTAVHVSS
jgi:hypothetical protein